MKRRELLAAITLLFTPTPSSAQDGLFKARSLNHLNIRVTDVARSETFYRKVLGLPPVRPVAGAAFGLDFPAGGFISLCPLSVATCGVKPDARAGDIDHFGVGIDNFNAERVESKLKAEGFNSSNNGRLVQSGDPSVFVADPDGTMVQLSAAKQTYRIPR
jgi:catechol 2,3-dioxygenase-like lactoylglutathione lyase family enzyme